MKSDLFSARKVNNKGGFSWILFSSFFWSSSVKDKRELRNYLGSKNLLCNICMPNEQFPDEISPHNFRKIQ